MNTISQINVYQTVHQLFNKANQSPEEVTASQLESVFNECAVGMEYNSEKYLSTIFLNALYKRLFSNSYNENIYDKQYEVPQIQLFDILIHKFPFVKYSQAIVNEAIVKIIAAHNELTIIDIGVGLGTQMLHIIEQAKSIPSLEKLNIIGIEPFGDALNKAQSVMNQIAADLPFSLNFYAVEDYVENIDFEKLPALYCPVIVNASLALHHVKSRAERNSCIERIRKINPRAFFLIEPNVDHFENDLCLRFKNSFSHFYHLFLVIDQLDITQNEKNALKLFFGREIEDIIGKKEMDRFEKHEPATKWISALESEGFSIDTEIF
jgi:hypothetical protein